MIPPFAADVPNSSPLDGQWSAGSHSRQSRSIAAAKPLQSRWLSGTAAGLLRPCTSLGPLRVRSSLGSKLNHSESECKNELMKLEAAVGVSTDVNKGNEAKFVSFCKSRYTLPGAVLGRSISVRSVTTPVITTAGIRLATAAGGYRPTACRC